MTARLVLDCRNGVGESLVWSVAEQALYWVDITGSRIHRLDPVSGAHKTWKTPEYPTSIGLRKDGGFIVGLRQRVVLWQPGLGFETFAVPEPDMPGNRLNEGVVAPDGSFWVGTMQDNIAPDGSPQAMDANTGRLYRIAPDGAVALLTSDLFGITNTMIWADNRFITADTLRDEIYVYDYDPVSQSVINRRLFAQTIGCGLPDGSTMDSEGSIYNARVAGGGCIARLASDGGIAGLIDLPCSSPTSCAFGGSDLTSLFVTSARFGLSSEHLAEHPVEGALFEITLPSAVGLPPSRFG
jgi:sugar lactone lactonase YvrE